MAKISARGDRELLRWKGTFGSMLVFTEQGRLLEKLSSDTTYRVRKPRGAKRWTRATASAQAAMLRYKATEARR